MDVLETFDPAPSDAPLPPVDRTRAIDALESGKVLYLPRTPFVLTPPEQALLDLDVTDGKAGWIDREPETDQLLGACPQGAESERLRRMMLRFTDWTAAVVGRLIPSYAPHLVPARTRYRPLEPTERPAPPRPDDTRLHVAADPARPNHGRRVLSVASNIDPGARPWVWDVGEPFHRFAAQLLPSVALPVPGSAILLRGLGATSERRTLYDHAMLKLNDYARLDEGYQTRAKRGRLEFVAGSTWIAYTDLLLHATVSGQHVLEQTFHLDVTHMADPLRAPLRVLEALTGRRLA